MSSGGEVEITGFLEDNETHLGQAAVTDLEQPWGKNHRLVDLRKIQSLVIKNVKYEVK